MPPSPSSDDPSTDVDVTLVLALGCAIAFAATAFECGGGLATLWAMPACGLVQRWGLVPAAVWMEGTWWQVFTAIFLHGSVLHLVLNLWSLLVVAPWVQRAWGRPTLLLVFLASGVGGCLASLAWAEAPLVVGASGGILGLAGALWIARRFGSEGLRDTLRPVSTRALGSSILVLVVLGGLVPVVAQAGHLGGLLVGSVLGAVLIQPTRHAGAWAVVVAAGLLVAGALAAKAPAWRPGYDSLRGFWWLDHGEPAQAIVPLERAHAREPADPELANAFAYALAETGQHLSKAEVAVNQAIQVGGDRPHYLDTLGWIRCRAGDVQGGLLPLWRALEGSPEDLVIAGHLATCPIAERQP